MSYDLALNLFDLDWIDKATRQRLLSGCLGRDPIKVPGGAAVKLVCDLARAALVCDVLRSNDRKLGDSATRVYISESGTAWRPLPADAVLTSIVNGKPELSARWFPAVVPMVEAVPLAPKRFE